jgi:purine-binding chemotaxis protein CheW
MEQLVVWSLDTQRYALPLAAVERVVRVVALTPLPDAPSIVCGIVNIQGSPVPVIDTRARFGISQRAILLSDQMLIARMRKRRVALLVDAVEGLLRQPDQTMVEAEAIVPGMGCVAGVAKLPDGMILIHDLDRCLSLEEEAVLEQSLKAYDRDAP